MTTKTQKKTNRLPFWPTHYTNKKTSNQPKKDQHSKSKCWNLQNHDIHRLFQSALCAFYCIFIVQYTHFLYHVVTQTFGRPLSSYDVTPDDARLMSLVNCVETFGEGDNGWRSSICDPAKTSLSITRWFRLLSSPSEAVAPPPGPEWSRALPRPNTAPVYAGGGSGACAACGCLAWSVEKCSGTTCGCLDWSTDKPRFSLYARMSGGEALWLCCRYAPL